MAAFLSTACSYWNRDDQRSCTVVLGSVVRTYAYGRIINPVKLKCAEFRQQSGSWSCLTQTVPGFIGVAYFDERRLQTATSLLCLLPACLPSWLLLDHIGHTFVFCPDSGTSPPVGVVVYLLLVTDDRSSGDIVRIYIGNSSFRSLWDPWDPWDPRRDRLGDGSLSSWYDPRIPRGS